MAMEALFQKSKATGRILEETKIHQISWMLRNVAFSKALVLDEAVDTVVMLSLNPCYGYKDSWHEFKVLSASDSITNEHCRGLIRITESSGPCEFFNLLQNNLIQSLTFHQW